MKRKESRELRKMPTLPSLTAATLLVAGCCCVGEEVCSSGQVDSFTVKPDGEDGAGLEVAVHGSKLTFALTNSLGLTVLSGSLGTTIPLISGTPLIRPDCEAELCLR